jgi:hypothetical protein
MIPYRQKILCFVGPDMCGKTEISSALSELTGIRRFKASSEHSTFKNKEKYQFVDQLRLSDVRQLDLLKQVGFSMIMDRGWPCEYAYSAYFGRETDFDQLLANDLAYAKLGAQIVFCHRSSYEGIVDDLDPTIGPVELQKIHNYYEEFLRLTSCQVMKLNVDDHDLRRQVSDICRELQV